ncbi:MAG: alpha/beta fold hydrolase [Coxiellaceae bacterium]|nr:alpha/beta fold hydrolase [Coxiellaceae bacterium]
MSKATINDISMYYEVHGKGEPLVLIAGFSADHLSWREVIKPLSKHYQVVVFDNRGAGQTDAPTGDYSIEQMSDDVIALCQHLGIEQAHFVGNSMGGKIVQMLGYRHANYVKSLVISNSSIDSYNAFTLYLEAQLELLKAEAPMRSIIKAICSWVYSYPYLSHGTNLNDLIELALNNPYPFTPQGYTSQRVALDEFNSSDWLHQINAPTLVIGGDLDIIFTPQMVKAIADNIPEAKYIELEECGHLPFIEHPEKFVDIVTTFLNDAREKK